MLDRIEAYLAQLERRALPKSVLGKAVSYAQNQWQALRRYTTDGRLSIDNNVSERTLRHQAIGRKNWLFLGQPAGRAAGGRSVHHPRRGQASSDRALDLPARTAPALACRRFASRRDAARSLGRQSSRVGAHLSARRIPPEGSSPAATSPISTGNATDKVTFASILAHLAAPLPGVPKYTKQHALAERLQFRRELGVLKGEMRLETSSSGDFSTTRLAATRPGKRTILRPFSFRGGIPANRVVLAVIISGENAAA